MAHISIVSPVYKAETIVDELVKRIIESVSKITADFEIILVEDRSPDNSWQKIEENCQKDKRVKGVQLSRNFGQHHAITAGLDYAKGDWVVIMDCDLQDRPEEIINLYRAVSASTMDGIIAKRYYREDNYFKKYFSRLFYKILSFLTGVHHDHSIANFGIYNQKIIESIKRLKESIRYFPTMVKWVGFDIGFLEVEHSSRVAGKTSYNFRKLLNLALDIFLAYSDKPIRLVIKLGTIISTFSFLFAIYNILKALNGGIAVVGYASLIISVWFLSGIIITILGVVGLYVGKTFEDVKKRPIYIIDKIIND
ncbi:MAG: glycosyltransferase family 2 protein [Bacteroidales bacterium]|nr:glycosyltransferase family 2 protein [Saprospiraceae bacterium]MCF8381569.1 glycosyltransferase family 2 protein [Bacteroidales bacterium]